MADVFNKARFFVLACRDLIITVDHKPLLNMFGDPSLDEISYACLRNLKEKTPSYRFCIIYIPGMRHKATDAISCHLTGLAGMIILPDDVALRLTYPLPALPS